MPAPHQGPADNLVRTFGFEPVDRDCPRDAAGLRVAQAAQAFRTAAKQSRCGFTNNRPVVPMSALPQGLRRPYGTDRSAAMELTSRLLNDDRAEDHDGPIGFESKTERARLFAAEMALQSFALLAAAEGAIAAYADITGETLEAVRGIHCAGCCRGPQSTPCRWRRFRQGDAPWRVRQVVVSFRRWRRTTGARVSSSAPYLHRVPSGVLLVRHAAERHDVEHRQSECIGDSLPVHPWSSSRSLAQQMSTLDIEARSCSMRSGVSTA